MRVAVVLVPNRFELLDSGAASVAWMRDALAQLGYGVVVLDAEGDVPSALAAALADVTPDDTVLVHAAGRLGPGTSLRLGAGRTYAFRALREAIAARGPRQVLIMTEVVHDEGEAGALAAAEHVEEIRSALDARARGYAALVAVRAADERGDGRGAGDPIAFTRLVLTVAHEVAAQSPGGAPLSVVVERLRHLPDRHAAAQSYALVRGLHEFPLGVAVAPVAASLVTPPAVEPPPVLEHLIALADGAASQRAWDLAIAGYRAALLVAHEPAAREAVRGRIVALASARGPSVLPRVAPPPMRASLASLPSLSASVVHAPPVVRAASSFVSNAAPTLPPVASDEASGLRAAPREEVDALVAIARRRVEHANDVAGAAEALERARALDPSRPDVLEALRRTYRVLARWADVLDVTGALAALAPSSAERAARRLAQARLCLERLGDPEGALRFLGAVLDEEPTHARALTALEELRRSRGEHAELEATLTMLASRLDALGEEAQASALRERIARLAGAAESDAAPAASPAASPIAVTSPVASEPPPPREPSDGGDVAARALLAEQLLARGADAAALVELEALAAEAPVHAPIHARLFELHAREGRIDRAYLSALALEELGVTRDDVGAVLERCRPDGLRIRAQLEEDGWALLRAPGADEVVEALLTAIGRAALAAHVDERRSARKLPALDPSRRQSPESTASAVRSFHWAARVLGAPCPALYVLDDVPGDVAAVVAAEPSTALGPGVVRGLSTKELAFVAGRHLTYYRPEHAALLAYPSHHELTVLVLAALQLAVPAMPIPDAVASAVSALGARLARHLTEAERMAMLRAIARLDARGGKIDLRGWIRSVELTSARAGLLLAGDLRPAMARLREDRRDLAGVTLAARREDLLAFCASRALASVRADVAIVESTPPPRTSGVVQSPWSSASGPRAEGGPV